MTVKNSLIIVFLAAFIVFLIGLTFNLSALEIRVGRIEHFLTHQGFFESHCNK